MPEYSWIWYISGVIAAFIVASIVANDDEEAPRDWKIWKRWAAFSAVIFWPVTIVLLSVLLSWMIILVFFKLICWLVGFKS